MKYTYGPPDIGETELVKAVAKELSLNLFEVSYADEDDKPINGNRRLNAFKSAFGKWIANLLDVPLIIKKGSDLLSMWVGGTEKNIANAFEEAERENAVLVFDEVDSFLQDRREANRSWEITQVNELLTQMESFEGVFIATTNLMDNLDQASLRRFDLKLEFSYMTEAQALMMFEKECKNLGINKPDKAVKKILKELKLLTPGDFAAVRRQHRFNPITNAADLLERLMQECAVKEDARKSVMGFL